MKKLFIAACLLLCLIPSVGMLFFPTTKTSENKPMAAAPQLLLEDGSLNRAFFSDFETWFTQRMALRNDMVYADAMVQSGVFHQSNVDGVILGTDGWLYYSATLPDYQGTDVMSQRELYNLAHNFSVVQQYLQQRQIGFVLTIAPNKNTLYPENMPYYDAPVANADHSAQLLGDYLQQTDVTYLDLFRLFRQQEEVLYLKRDSHWNAKGAYLVYRGLMEQMALTPDTYGEPGVEENTNGDLNRMLYGFHGIPESDYVYDLPLDYTYASKSTSVEDGWLITENANGSGTLLMFRDSFANNLIPFFSQSFQTAYYSKGEPNLLEMYVELYQPDQVVIQKVERNIADYLENPPILTPPEAQLPSNILIAQTETGAVVENTDSDTRYYRISGTVEGSQWLHTDTQIVVRVGQRYYQAYHTGEEGFLLYLKKEDVAQTDKLQVYLVNGDTCTQVMSSQIVLP